ncbi:hypothetical protein A3F06_02715 [candidate division TM6 bacterium RIFCSPHIGHO2_12_FULL_36_22]|nr:MAG: hypothetical protein A3F06_02715 [candidate division TM6 bacterium RIFCSPHIGHO2_12_FULL_36_22]
MKFSQVVPFEGLQKIILHAGDLLRKFHIDSLTKSYKAGGSFATEADIASEKFLIEQLQALLPGSGIWAEESGKQLNNNSYYWVIDPLDGTNNFVQRIPFSCVSVALVSQEQIIIGVIYDFHRDEIFVASRGNGAYLNGQSIHVSSKKALQDAIISAPIAYRGQVSATERRIFWNELEDVDKQCCSIRILGSAALSLAYVACGRLDIALFDRLSWWDVAAGSLLIEEAGGTVTTFSGKPIDCGFKTLIGGPKVLYDQLFVIVSK